jgi:thioredoxin-like negative regulator of GroEL
MRLFLAAALAAMIACVLPGGSSAKPDSDADTTTPRTEVVVFEIGGCKYCEAFRGNLGARYLASTTNRAAPMRFVDVGKLDPQAFQLRADINTVPTIVLLQDGREVDRVEGYPLPELLFGMVKSRVGSGEN